MNQIELNETLELDPAENYPFRDSLLKKARCGMCKNGRLAEPQIRGGITVECLKGHDLMYPLITCEHDCIDYEYRPDFIIPEKKRFEECNDCSQWFYMCDGISWTPISIKNGKCEFFREQSKLCKHAIPYLQYGDHHRNNFCKLPPEERDGDSNRGWKWKCPYAHHCNAEGLKCYEVKK